MPADLPDAFLLEPTPHAEAVKWLQNKPAVSREVFDELLPELRARAICITGIEDAAVVGEIRDVLAELPAGLEWEKTKRQLVAKLGPWIGADDPAGAQKAREARAELLLRTHGFQAYQVTQHAVMRRQEDVFPYWQYLSSGDEKVRPAHAALNEVVAPANSKFWADHSPPWQWGCRCRKVPLLPDEVDEIKAEDARKPPEAQRVLEGSTLRRAEDGTLDRGPASQVDIRSDRMRGKPSGYVFDPDSLALPLDQLEGRYDAQTWSEFRSAMEKATLPDGRTAWGWLNGEKGLDMPSRPPQVPVIAPSEPTTRTPPPPRAKRPVVPGKIRPYMTQEEIEDLAKSRVDKMTVDQVKEEALRVVEKRGLSRATRNEVFRSRGRGEARSLAIQGQMAKVRREMEDMQGTGQPVPENDDSDLIPVKK